MKRIAILNAATDKSNGLGSLSRYGRNKLRTTPIPQIKIPESLDTCLLTRVPKLS